MDSDANERTDDTKISQDVTGSGTGTGTGPATTTEPVPP